MMNKDEILKKFGHEMNLEEFEYLTFNDFSWFVLRTRYAPIQLKTAIKMLNFLKYDYTRRSG